MAMWSRRYWLKERRSSVRRSNLLAIISLLFSAVVWAPVFAQQKTPPQPQRVEQSAYEIVCLQKDPDELMDLARKFSEKHPRSAYAEYAETVYARALYRKFQLGLQAYYATPDASNLEQLVGAGEKILSKQPDQVYVVTQVALAAGDGVRRGYYSDSGRVRAGLKERSNFWKAPTRRETGRPKSTPSSAPRP